MTRRILAAVAAVVIALVGSVAVIAYAHAADRRALAGQEAVRVYVARREVPAGTTAGKAVQDGLLSLELIARKAVPDDALTAVDGGYDQLVASSTIQPGELVLRTRFAARGTTEGALFVPEGKLAVTVALDDPSHVGPFVVVGSKVTIFDTFNVQDTATTDKNADKNADQNAAKAAGNVPAGDHLQDRHEFRRATRLLLPSLEVLAVGSSTTAIKPAAGDAKDAAALGSAGQQTLTLFTLAVTQDQAERLVHGARTGTLTFALLGTGPAPTPGTGADDTTLFGSAK